MTSYHTGVPSQQPSMRQQLRPVHAVGPCFACGEMGHFKRTCTKSAPGAGRWYPSNLSVKRAGTDSQREVVECGNKGEVDVKCSMGSTQRESIGFDSQGVRIVTPCDVDGVVYEDTCSSTGETKATFTQVRFQSKTNTFLSVLASRLHQNNENAYPRRRFLNLKT